MQLTNITRNKITDLLRPMCEFIYEADDHAYVLTQAIAEIIEGEHEVD